MSAQGGGQSASIKQFKIDYYYEQSYLRYVSLWPDADVSGWGLFEYYPKEIKELFFTEVAIEWY